MENSDNVGDLEKFRLKYWDVENINDIEVCPKCNQPSKQMVNNKLDSSSKFVCFCNLDVMLHKKKKKYSKTIFFQDTKPFVPIIGNPKINN